MTDLISAYDAWDGSAPRLSRRERAACELAVVLLRSRSPSHARLHRAWRALEMGSERTEAIADASAHGGAGTSMRLALYLRALLRQDRGDFGSVRSERTGTLCTNLRHRRERIDGGRRCTVTACGCYRYITRITPLWEMAR